VAMIPWTWARLKRPQNPQGVVLFGANHLATTTAQARIAALLANYFEASPMAVRIITGKEPSDPGHQAEDKVLISAAQAEVQTMGAELYATVTESEDISQGILQVAHNNRSWAIVLGYSMSLSAANFQRVIGQVVDNAPCPTIVARFRGVLHTERILVPIISMRELYVLRHVIKALAAVGQHQITLLRLLPSYETEKQQDKAKNRLRRWAEMENLGQVYQARAVATEARKETVLAESDDHDLVIMAGPRSQGLHRLFFGSLSAEVVHNCTKTVLTVFPPGQ